MAGNLEIQARMERTRHALTSSALVDGFKSEESQVIARRQAMPREVLLDDRVFFIGQPATKCLHFQRTRRLAFLHAGLNEFLQQLFNGLFFQPREDSHLVDIARRKLKRNRDLLLFLPTTGRSLGILQGQIRKESAHAHSVPGAVFFDGLFFLLRNPGGKVVAAGSANFRTRHRIGAGFLGRSLVRGCAGLFPADGREVFLD